MKTTTLACFLSFGIGIATSSASASGTIEVVANISPLLPTTALEAEAAVQWVYLRGAFSERTSSGVRIFGFTLAIDLLNARNEFLGSSEVNSSSTGFTFDTMIAKLLPLAGGLDPAELARIRVRLVGLDTEETRAKEERERQAKERAAALKAKSEEERRRRLEAEVAAQATARREAGIRAKRWPAEIESAVIARKIAIGMTTEQVLAAWGEPRTINETITSVGKSEHWVYGDAQLLYFDNGILKTIQRRRER